MRYLGGKSRIAKKLVATIEPIRRGRQFWDPFCGGLSVSVALSDGGPGLVSDANPSLIALYKAVREGWDPPTALSYDEWLVWRDAPDEDPRKAFARFGCTFGGNWSSGYARAGDENFAKETRNVLLRDIGKLKKAGCELACIDFLEVDPRPIAAVLYLDPPYRGTTAYPGVPPFDHDRFYARVAAWSRHTDVFVSEYAMPWGRRVLDFSHNLNMGPNVKKGARCERLYHYSPDRILDGLVPAAQ